ncbi:hypothetical protein HZH68_011607 [Vespula germanica]|uniref:Uncharacterized protein n=1 Tax=Vespula germanica TaxID=30212 RepID=A0A834JPF7_VESGE|nr:hypothetical protein HZH68_011607 [Vespula germanica]
MNLTKLQSKVVVNDENPRGQSESSKTRRRLIMKCIRTSRHFSRHLLSFSPSEALHLRHLLTFLLIGLTFLRSVLPCDYEKSRLRENEPEQLLTNKDIGYPRDEANKEQQEQWTAQTEKENKPILKFPRRSEVEYSKDELARSDFILNDDIFMKDLLIKENGLSTRRRKRRKKSHGCLDDYKHSTTVLIQYRSNRILVRLAFKQAGIYTDDNRDGGKEFRGAA